MVVLGLHVVVVMVARSRTRSRRGRGHACPINEGECLAGEHARTGSVVRRRRRGQAVGLRRGRWHLMAVVAMMAVKGWRRRWMVVVVVRRGGQRGRWHALGHRGVRTRGRRRRWTIARVCSAGM